MNWPRNSKYMCSINILLGQVVLELLIQTTLWLFDLNLKNLLGLLKYHCHWVPWKIFYQMQMFQVLIILRYSKPCAGYLLLNLLTINSNFIHQLLISQFCYNDPYNGAKTLRFHQCNLPVQLGCGLPTLYLSVLYMKHKINTVLVVPFFFFLRGGGGCYCGMGAQCGLIKVPPGAA